MADHFNQLTPAMAERLAMLAEECAEVVQIVCKIQRHGAASYHPNDKNRVPNAELMRSELIDLLAVMLLMKSADDFRPITDAEIDRAVSKKLLFAHHQ